MIEDLKRDIQAKLAMAPPLGYVVDIDLGDDGHIILDGSNGPTQILDHSDKAVDTTLTVSLQKMSDIVAGQADANMAVLLGQMKVSGKMGVALKLASYLE